MAQFRVDLKLKDGREFQLLRVLDNTNKRDQNEAYRNGLNIDKYSFRQVGKYKDRLGFIYYFYI